MQAGTGRTVGPLCGGPRDSKQAGVIGVKGFIGAKEADPFDLIPSTLVTCGHVAESALLISTLTSWKEMISFFKVANIQQPSVVGG